MRKFKDIALSILLALGALTIASAQQGNGIQGGQSGNPAGANTQVQYNNSGAFGGSANLTWNNGTSTLSATNVTVSGTCTGCGSGVSQSTGNFVVTFTAACTVNPTITYQYVKTGNEVSIRPSATSGFPCTGNSTSFSSSAAAVTPAGLLPTAVVAGGYFNCTDNGNSIACGIHILTDGTLKLCVFGIATGTPDTPTGQCVDANWTAAGSRSVNVTTTTTMGNGGMTYILN